MSLNHQEIEKISKSTQHSDHHQDSILQALQGKDFQEKIDFLQDKVDFYDNLEKQAEEKRKNIFDEYKRKGISGEEYTNQVKELLPYEVTESPIYSLKKQIRELQVQQDIEGISQEQIFTHISQLGDNISDGGTNNKGVFLLGEKFVARLSARGYDDASRLILYKEKIQSPVIKKTLQIVELEGNVYQVQQRAIGKPILQLSSTDRDSIPSDQYEAFWDAIAEMRALGLSLDISGGKSNVFYDTEQGFSIIDLGIGGFPENEVIETLLFK